MNHDGHDTPEAIRAEVLRDLETRFPGTVRKVFPLEGPTADPAAVRGDLVVTMELVENPTAWLETDDPEQFRAEMIRKASQRFVQWLDLVAGPAG